MFKSIYSRMGLSYLLLITCMRLLFAVGMFFSLRQSPLLYRTTISRLAITKAVLLPRLRSLQSDGIEQLKNVIRNENLNDQLRIAIITTDGQVVFDSAKKSAAPLPYISDPSLIADKEERQAEIYRDERRNVWFYTVGKISTNYYLLLLIQRPLLPLIAILQDDFLRPLLQTALVALGLALLLSLVMTRWIAGPLFKMAQSANKMASGDFEDIPLKGPKEVQQLSSALNIMNKKLLQTLQSQRDFVANVSHELKTPITSMQGFAQALVDGTVKSRAGVQKAGKVILDETDRLHRLVVDLLALTRFETGMADLKSENIELTAIIYNILEKYLIILKTANIRIIFQPKRQFNIMGDGDRISQVFSNILDNAIKFSPNNSEIQINLEKEENSVLIKISDEGPGIQKEDQLRVFERFYQVDKSRKGGEGRGVGLGLAISNQIIHAHSGKIWVESDGMKGSTFVVELPIIQS
jgi:signal transduction histidine kinase